MSDLSNIRIKPTCILNVPLQTYESDFTFIVNNDKFPTSRLISDLISPIICHLHSNDPTIDTFTINTRSRGDFSHIINLLSFRTSKLPSSELPFICEVIEILGNDSISVDHLDEGVELSTDNVLKLIKQQEGIRHFFESDFLREIEYASAHLSDLLDELEGISFTSLFDILSNSHLQLKSEDELLRFVNRLYQSDTRYSCLYEFVLFENVSTDAMKEFTETYDINDMSGELWKMLRRRLEVDVNLDNEHCSEMKRYSEGVRKSRVFSETEENDFNGILNFLRKKSNNEIEKEIGITASSVYNDSENYHPRNIVLFENQVKHFASRDEPNSWICIDFKKHRVIPTSYTIRSYANGKNTYHPKSWVIECRNEDSMWETVDEVRNCPYLNEFNVSHTFKMNRQVSKEFRYVRMRLTGPDWYGTNYLDFDSLEIYGKLI